MSLEIVPISLKEANVFVEEHHRHHHKTVGHKFSIGCSDGYKIVGVAIVGRPVARIFLRVTDVRVERLQRICERGRRSAHNEGFINDISLAEGTGKSATEHFSEFWDSTIKPKDRALYGWEANPWVWVIEFERISREEAEHEQNKN